MQLCVYLQDVDMGIFDTDVRGEGSVIVEAAIEVLGLPAREYGYHQESEEARNRFSPSGYRRS